MSKWTTHTDEADFNSGADSKEPLATDVAFNDVSQEEQKKHIPTGNRRTSSTQENPKKNPKKNPTVCGCLAFTEADHGELGPRNRSWGMAS